MRKRLLALISASAIVALMFGGAPRAAMASIASTGLYDYYISARGDASGLNKSCAHPFSQDLQAAFNDSADNNQYNDNTAGIKIFLCAGTYYGQFDTLNNPDVEIIGQSAKSTIISGDFPTASLGEPVILAGDPFSLDFSTGADLTVRNLTIKGGNSNSPGGAVVTGQFHCFNSVLDHNYSSAPGGAVWAKGVVTNKCTYSNNYSEYQGGAIWAAQIDDQGGKYVSNCAVEAGGAIFLAIPNGGPYGGSAIPSTSSTFSKSTFINNDTSTGNCINFGYNDITSGLGGAIYAELPVSIVNSTFADNAAGRSGGAVFSISDLTVRSSKFTGNTADFQGGAIATANVPEFTYRCGVLILNLNDYGCVGTPFPLLPSLSVSGSTFRSNTAGGAGGAIMAGPTLRGIGVTNAIGTSVFANNSLVTPGPGFNITAIDNAYLKKNRYLGGGGSGVQLDYIPDFWSCDLLC